jgi:tetratricopeptide (TPR) repeat protein
MWLSVAADFDRFMSEKGLSEDLNDLLTAAFKAYEVCPDLNKDLIDYAHLCNTIGVVTHNRGEFARAGHYFQQCHDIRSQSNDPDPEEMANIYNNLGIVCFSVLDYEKALDWHKKAETIRMTRGDDWAPAKGMTHLNMGRALWRLNQKDKAWNRLRSAIQQFEFSGNWYLLSQ